MSNGFVVKHTARAKKQNRYLCLSSNWCHVANFLST